LQKLEAQNQDPWFLFSRIINASCLLGKYSDDRGKRYEFTNILRGVFPDEMFFYTLEVTANNQLTMINSASKKRYGIVADQGGITLRPTKRKARPIVLQRLP
jgi:hypothetical protein